MSPVTGAKQDIVQTRDGYNQDYALTDKLPLSTSAQRKIAQLPDGTLVTAFYTNAAKLAIALSNGGVKWKIIADILGQFSIPAIANAFNPALAVDKYGVLHLAFRAFGADTAPYTLIWYTKSKDGIKWTTPLQLPAVNGQIYYHGYPVIDAGPQDEVYISFDFADSLYVIRSLNSGKDWVPAQQIALSSGKDTRPSMAVASDGTVYIAYSEYFDLFCCRSQDQGKSWTKKKVFGSSRAGGHYPSIAIDSHDRPVIAYLAEGSNLGPDIYRAIHVQWQEKSWSSAWQYIAVDNIYDAKIFLHMPSLAINKEDVLHLAYVLSHEASDVFWPQWPHNIMHTSSHNWTDWAAPTRLTECHNGQLSPQGWPNLYWQQNRPAQTRGCTAARPSLVCTLFSQPGFYYVNFSSSINQVPRYWPRIN